jgi:hypothetical protein
MCRREAAKQLLIKSTFFQDLEFFDKDHISDEVYAELGEYYHNALMQPQIVEQSSVAAACLCRWVRAIYEYSNLMRNLRPRVSQLQGAEDDLNKVCLLFSLAKIALVSSTWLIK